MILLNTLHIFMIHTVSMGLVWVCSAVESLPDFKTDSLVHFLLPSCVLFVKRTSAYLM